MEYALASTITLTDTFNFSWTIYNGSNQSYNYLFHWNDTQCCTPPDLQMINATSDSNYQNTVQVILDGYVISDQQFSLKNLGFKQRSSYSINDKIILINNYCESERSEDKIIESGMIRFQIGVIDQETNRYQLLTFQYWFICQYIQFEKQQQIKINFDTSIIMLVLLGCVFVWIFTKIAKIRSLKIKIDLQKYPYLQRIIAIQQFQLEDQVLYFQGFIVNWILFILYIIASILFYVLVHYFINWYEVVMIMCLTFSFFCCWFIFNELQCFLSLNLNLQAKLFLSIQAYDIISILLSIIIIVLYVKLGNPWYISNLITFCIAGSLFRLFKVINLRQVAYLYLAIILFDCFYYFFLLTDVFYINYQIIVLQEANYPVLFQIPQFKYNYNKVCVWLSLMDLVIPGISISYLYRFDKNRNSRVYFVIGMLGLFFGIICWSLGTLPASLNGVQLPQSIFVYTLIIIFTCLWALRQGDLRIIWYGQFYDKYLMDNFIIDSSPESNQNMLEQSNLEKKQLENLMKGLKLDSQL